MLNSLVCKIFHKKEVQVIDIADALLLDVLSAIILGMGTYLVYDFYLYVEGDLPSFMFGAALMLVIVSVDVVAACLFGKFCVSIYRYCYKHAHDVVVVCPKYAKETKEE